jgi:hypothetical protein
MMHLKIIFLLLMLPSALFGQSISNIRLESSHDKVWLLYDLQATAPQDVSIVFVSDTKGKVVPKLISGALIRVPAGVNHRIDWEALKDVGAFEGDLYAELRFGKGLTITVNGRKLEVADQDLSNSMKWDDAVRACQNLGSGWRLPDKDELKAMYEQLHKQGKGNFKDDWYWSSSQYGSGTAWYVYFHYGGRVDFTNEGHNFRVRAVRAF